MKKSSFSSYFLKDICKGCKYCIKGKKLVLFITGKCSRNCIYCPLSKKRKNIDKVWANERFCKNEREAVQEARESNALGAGITGGDPLLVLSRTIKYSKALKKEFGKKFHIHIYLPTKLIDKEKILRLKPVIDEIRMHPEFLINSEKMQEDLEKIILVSKIFGRNKTGIELPMIPEKKLEILDFIKKIEKYISFVNLNEMELGETNFEYITKKYPLNKEGYVVSSSKKAGIDLLKKLEKLKLKVHLCTADTKNWYQFRNRLIQHKILPFGKKTQEGTVIYLYTPEKISIVGSYFDKEKNRTILSEKTAKKLWSKREIFKSEEFPTCDRIETELQKIN